MTTSNSGLPLRPATTDATRVKRDQLTDFISLKLAPHPSVQAVVAFGSLTTGTARPDSDIDAYVFMDPLDQFVVPAESVWRARDDTFHSIFADDDTLEQEGIQLDLHRVDLARWRDQSFFWPENVRADLAGGWVAFDRHNEVAALIAERTAYSDDERQRVIDDAVVFVAGQLADGTELPDTWETLGIVNACDGLQAAYQYLVHALFAYNRQWRPWRNREIRTMRRLRWLPPEFERYLIDAAIFTGHDAAAYSTRARALTHLLNAITEQLTADGHYSTDDPLSEAFIRTHDEPGRAWNMTAWNAHRHRI